MINKIKNYLKKVNVIKEKIDFILESLGRIENRQVQESLKKNDLQNFEFKVYSQSGEDGIVQCFLIDCFFLIATLQFGIRFCSDYHFISK